MEEKEFNSLLQRFAHDREAFRKLYRFYYPRIVLHIRKVYPGADAESVGQEFFTRLIKMNNIGYVRYPTAWVFAVCRNLVKDCAENFTAVAFDENVAGMEAESRYAAIDENSDISEQARQILDGMEKTTRRIVVLHYWGGYTFREIAEICGMNEAAVRQRHFRAIKKVRNSQEDVTKADKKGVLLMEVRKWNTTD